jgi:hypothetical protein
MEKYSAYIGGGGGGGGGVDIQQHCSCLEHPRSSVLGS